MFGIGTTEVLVILVVALLVIGPSKLPDVARSLGKGLAEFKRMSSDVKRTIDLESQFRDTDQSSAPNAATGHAAGTKSQQETQASQSSAQQEAEPAADQGTREQEAEQPAEQQEEEIPEVKYAAGEKDKGTQDG
ncbi:MAG: twin-arginine translocase TatA/TatE family subunit [Desulfohalobiaceae bacterium]